MPGRRMTSTPRKPSTIEPARLTVKRSPSKQHREQAGPDRHQEFDREHGRERQHDDGIGPAQVGDEMRAVADEVHARLAQREIAEQRRLRRHHDEQDAQARRRLRTISSSNRLSTPPSWRTEIAISENDSSVPIIHRTAAGTLDFRGCDGCSGSPRAPASTGVTLTGSFSCSCGVYSASGWFSGRALSKAGSFRQAASTAAIFGYLRHVDLEAPRVEHLRHEAKVGDRDVRAERVGAGPDQRLDRVEALHHPVPIPVVDRRLIVLQRAFEVVQRDQIVQRMDVAGDDLRHRAHLRALDRVGRQQRRLGLTSSRYSMIASDCSSTSPVGERERRHALLRIDRAEFLAPLPAAVAGQMHRRLLVGQLLQVERDAHPIGRGRAEIAIEFHGRFPGVRRFHVLVEAWGGGVNERPAYQRCLTSRARFHWLGRA